MNKLILVFLLATLAVQGQDSEKSKVYFNKGLQQFAQGKSKEAIVSFDMAINFDSANYDAWIKRGFCKGKIGDFEGEMSDYTRVIQVDPKHKWAYISRGSAYNRISKFDEAINDFNMAITIDPTDAEAYNNRGFARKGLGDKEGACSDWNKSKKLGNDEAKIILKNNLCK